MVHVDECPCALVSGIVKGTRQDETTFRVVLSRLVFRGSRFRLVSRLLAKSGEVLQA